MLAIGVSVDDGKDDRHVCSGPALPRASSMRASTLKPNTGTLVLYAQAHVHMPCVPYARGVRCEVHRECGNWCYIVSKHVA